MRFITVHRRGYTRKEGTRVKGTTYRMKDRGKPGKGPKLFSVKKGKLAPYHTNMPAKLRHQILKRKIKKYGALSVFRSLNAQVVFRKREKSRAKEVFKKDRDWVKKNFLNKKRR